MLFTDDDDAIRDMAGTALRYAGFEVTVAADGRAALDAVTRVRPDLVVLDVRMPGLDGFEVCRRLRASGDSTPVIFLTARAASRDILEGFGHGADDYVTKPFVLDELVARVRAVLQRSGNSDGDGLLRCGDVELDEARHEVRRGDRALDVSPTEFNLLRYLLMNAGNVVSKQQILDRLWPDGHHRDGHVVETYISSLRRKIDQDDLASYIRTIRRVGYTIRSPET